MNHRRQRESKSGDTCSFRDAIANIGILFLTLTLTLTLSLILTHITNPDGQNNSLTIAPLKVNASPKMFKWVDLRVQKGWGVGRVLGRGLWVEFSTVQWTLQNWHCLPQSLVASNSNSSRVQVAVVAKRSSTNCTLKAKLGCWFISFLHNANTTIAMYYRTVSQMA